MHYLCIQHLDSKTVTVIALVTFGAFLSLSLPVTHNEIKRHFQLKTNSILVFRWSVESMSNRLLLTYFTKWTGSDVVWLCIRPHRQCVGDKQTFIFIVSKKMLSKQILAWVFFATFFGTITHFFSISKVWFGKIKPKKSQLQYSDPTCLNVSLDLFNLKRENHFKTKLKLNNSTLLRQKLFSLLRNFFLHTLTPFSTSNTN